MRQDQFRQAMGLGSGIDLVREFYSEADASYFLTLRVPDVEIRRMAFGQDAVVSRLIDAVDREVGKKALAHWYGRRPRPRLGAGTVGYARRRR